MKVLIIEDDPLTVESLSLLFRLRQPEAKVIIALKGEKGIELVEKESPDIVILDLGLPDIDGMDVLKEIRSFSRVPLIILTARSATMEIVKGLELGADDYIVKPFDPIVLLARVKNVLRHTLEQAGEETVIYGDMAIDLVRGEIKKPGEMVKLSATEVEILSLLIANEGKVVSHTTLMERVWGEGVETTDLLRKYIQYLREKLGDDPNNPRIILSERGRGYKFLRPK